MKNNIVIHISGNKYVPFPSEHHTKKIWKEMATGFSEYHIFARSEGFSYSSSRDGNIFLHLIPTFGFGMWEFFFTSWIVLFYVLKIKPSHIIAQCPVLGGWAASMCSIFFGIPIFMELHGAHYFKPAGTGIKKILEFFFYRVFSEIPLRVAKKIRSLSDDMNSNIEIVYGNKALKKTVTIPTRVDFSVFKNLKDNYKIQNELNIVTVGSLSTTKNHINLMRDLKEADIKFKLTIIGEGALKNEYINIIKELNINVNLTGNLSQNALSEILATQDVYVHYSVSEGLSRAILEAMAIGLPVITTNVGFINGVLMNEINSMVINKPWNKNLILAIDKMLKSEKVREDLGRNARNIIFCKYNSDAVFKLYRKEVLEMI